MHLDERATPAGGLPIAEVEWLAANMCVALKGLHALGVLHRDVKPNNILLRHDGYWQLTDLGGCSAWSFPARR